MIDRVTIQIISGKGGDGAISGRREKYVPRGGPDGGDGGVGGSVYLVADPNVNTLLAYRYRRHFTAESGGRGERRLRHGKNGADVTLQVPVGTQVWADDAVSGPALLADLDEPGERWLAAAGGAGGAGNAHYATSTNRFPRLAQAGMPGEERTLRLELKLLADVGIVGAPNAGKSSLISAVSAARPKVADYAFTTLEPSLGVVERRGETFVMVDIPGLIEGAHVGVGLGHEFLRHVERTRVLIHLVDGAQDDPVGVYRQINAELSQYDPRLAIKPQILAVNKLDLTDVHVLREELREAFEAALPPEPDERAGELPYELAGELGRPRVHFVSAATGEGVGELLDATLHMLRETPPTPQMPLAAPPGVGDGDADSSGFGALPVLRPEPRRRRPRVSVDDEGVFVVDWPPAARMATMIGPDDWAAKMQFYHRLERAGIVEALEAAGAGPGDVVQIGEAELVWE